MQNTEIQEVNLSLASTKTACAAVRSILTQKQQMLQFWTSF